MKVPEFVMRIIEQYITPDVVIKLLREKYTPAMVEELATKLVQERPDDVEFIGGILDDAADALARAVDKTYEGVES